jgi:DNA mismatch repair ATPase MutS
MVASPVKFSTFQGQTFVSIYIYQGRSDARLITGANMGGKSTRGRMLSFPLWLRPDSLFNASGDSGGFVDKVFCRIGASDDLSGTDDFYGGDEGKLIY